MEEYESRLNYNRTKWNILLDEFVLLEVIIIIIAKSIELYVLGMVSLKGLYLNLMLD